MKTETKNRKFFVATYIVHKKLPQKFISVYKNIEIFTKK